MKSFPGRYNTKQTDAEVCMSLVMWADAQENHTEKHNFKQADLCCRLEDFWDCSGIIRYQ